MWQAGGKAAVLNFVLHAAYGGEPRLASAAQGLPSAQEGGRRAACEAVSVIAGSVARRSSGKGMLGVWRLLPDAVALAGALPASRAEWSDTGLCRRSLSLSTRGAIVCVGHASDKASTH